MPYSKSRPHECRQHENRFRLAYLKLIWKGPDDERPDDDEGPTRAEDGEEGGDARRGASEPCG